MQKNGTQRKYFRTPFCAEYWRQAFSELKNTRTLAFAAMILALRIAMKPLKVPIAADVSITFGFIANAFGSMVYGPVVALLGGALSDTLGYLVAPSGPYFLPFILTEMAGSFVFALFLYSTDITPGRLILSKFCVNLIVNILMTEPIMIWYYSEILKLVYQPFMWVRIVKNIVMLPFESLILMVVFRALLPAVSRIGFTAAGRTELDYTRKHIILLVCLFVTGAAAVGGYAVYDYNNKSFSASYTAQERLARNTEMNTWVTEEISGLDAAETVTVIESARSRVGSREMTYELAIYRIDRNRFAEKQAAAEDGKYTEETLRGYSKSKAAKDDALVRIGTGTAVTDKNTGEHLSLDIQKTWNEENP